MEDFEREMKLLTIEESTDHIGQLEDILNLKGCNDIDADDLDTIFRIVHSIKGNTRSSGYEDIAAISHSFESRLAPCKTDINNFTEPMYELTTCYMDTLAASLKLLEEDIEHSLDFSVFLQKLDSQGQKKSPSNKEYKFLVVDDDESVREIISEYIGENFSSTINAGSNGQEALELLENVKVDVIICDYKMPVLDGKSFIQKLRSSSSINKETHIIFLSGFRPKLEGDYDVWENVFFLDKPFTENKLIYYIKCSFFKN